MPALTSRTRSRRVAAMTRTLTGRYEFEPTDLMRCSARARRSLGCTSTGSSPSSSRKMVPPSASTNGETRLSTAPVNEPRSWPKRALSASVAGMAPQSTTTNGLLRARARLVDGLRDELLAGARLAGDEHREVRRRGLLQALEDAAHPRRSARPAGRSRRGPGTSTSLGPDGRELHHRVAERHVRVLGEVDLAHARVADERAVARAEVAQAHAALGRDELHVHGADLAVVEHQVAGLVPADHDGLGADFELLLGARALRDRELSAADLDPGPRGDGRIHARTSITADGRRGN